MHQDSMKLVRRALVATVWMALLVTTAACAKAKREQSPAARLVQRELREEFNTRYLDVSEKSPDTLHIELTGGRLAEGGSGKLGLSPHDRMTLARRAIELLAPPARRGSSGIRTVVVDVTSTRRFGPILFGSKYERTTHDVLALFAAGTEESIRRGSRAAPVVTLDPPTDSMRGDTVRR